MILSLLPVSEMVYILLDILLMYTVQVGFFRRKKKPGEEDIEGDFDAPPESKSGQGPAVAVSYEKPTDEATTV